jgi:hypothetical protein
MAAVIGNREFKLLLKPECFKKRSDLLAFAQCFRVSCRELDVPLTEEESLISQVREVSFYDTEAYDFRHHNLILRQRRFHQQGWPEDGWEVTFKCRSPDYRQAASFNIRSNLPDLEKQRFKEELLMDRQVGTMRSIFSHNCILDSPPMQLESDLKDLAQVLPGLESLSFSLDQPVKRVRDLRIIEIASRLGDIHFGYQCNAHVDFALWRRKDNDEPLVGEFSFAYKILGTTAKHQAGHEAADRFYLEIQKHLKEWVAIGTTKTALVYQTQE